MENKTVTLKELEIGRSAVVKSLACEGGVTRRLMELGFVPGAEVRALHRSPCGDPVAYAVLGAVIALRASDTARIEISPKGSLNHETAFRETV